MKLSNILQACEAFSVDPAMKSSLACGTVERKEQVLEERCHVHDMATMGTAVERWRAGSAT